MDGLSSLALTQAFRLEWGRVVAYLIRMTGDWDLAEECAQEAVARAAERWPRDGIPANPGAWLTTTARNHALNVLRRSATEAAKLPELATMAAQSRAGEIDPFPDERLRLIFTCCHPALPLEGRVALTLRTLAGLTTPEIARAFLVSETAMAQRIVRTKRKIRAAGIPYRVPPAHLLAERIGGVLGVLYLLFTEGYAATSGPHPLRQDLCAEAIHLARMVARLMPDEPEILGLLSLLLLQHSRCAARIDEAGDLVALSDQDRSRWDAAAIAEGLALLDTAAAHGCPGPYQLQAAIAACHALAPDAAATDWPRIATLYARLIDLNPTPVVRLNHAVAVAMADGPAAGLELLDLLADSPQLATYHLLAATRADFLRRLDHRAEAAAAYRQALTHARTDAERRYLARRLAETVDQAAERPVI
ncbi:MAG TPA: sigma-70 family RNA polymerase sigma factor [Mycobacteriales bacterium]|nr:sigma-70 family RNA polymerase sigma factor [Mycobacteriales bacterium]